MIEGALAPYEGALQQASSLSLLSVDGRVLPLAIQRYLADADPVDRTVLDKCLPPVLDVGCGPGRIVHALSAAGVPALGVDIADLAVALTQRRGAIALIRSVFERVPGEGRWPTVLVLDGNIGIGGDVTGLLRRLADLMAPGGSVIVEASTSEFDADEVLEVRFSTKDEVHGPQFPWAVVGATALIKHAERAALAVADYWSAGGRVFVRFERDTVIR
ncbi:MAG: class I SAM-dependent methyltransferase [Actinomycetota bacterium]|nr:class I SAM-dependent methyltransferase [Actinomycetota bacterium]MDQ2957453.1 class I SAM-dependent methyltransferase [Actinomycetota bacterium]